VFLVFKSFLILVEEKRKDAKIFKQTRIFLLMARFGRKVTGGKYKKFRKKRLHDREGKPHLVILGEEKRKKIKVMGGKEKTILLRTNKVNVFDSKEKKVSVVSIKNVLEVPSNRFLARKNVIVKGAILDTEAGKARVTNRPGQEGCVQAVLI